VNDHAAQTQSLPLERFRGGPALTLAASAGAVGLALTLVGYFTAPKEALISYLISFAYWLGISLGALVLLMANHAAHARWVVVVRRLTETIIAPLPLFALLFLPILFGARQIFIWVDPPATLGKEVLALLAHKRPYLNLGFFAIRAAVYFGTWLLLSLTLRRWSSRQDAEGGAQLTLNARRFSAGGLPFLAFTMTFAAFDWIMSLNPTWFSTILGLYYFAGSFVAAIALLCIAAAAAHGTDTAFGRMLTPSHFHNLGKYLFAFVAFWAYIGFSQYMLIWVANLPEEIPWVQLRDPGPFRFVGVFLILFHFLVPFFALLSRDLKRNPRALAIAAVWVLLVHFVDLYWVIMPAAGGGARPTSLGLHWTQLTSFVGIGGAAIAFGLWRLRGGYPVPVGDPYLEDSLRYVQP